MKEPKFQFQIDSHPGEAGLDRQSLATRWKALKAKKKAKWIKKAWAGISEYEQRIEAFGALNPGKLFFSGIGNTYGGVPKHTYFETIKCKTSRLSREIFCKQKFYVSRCRVFFYWMVDLTIDKGYPMPT